MRQLEPETTHAPSTSPGGASRPAPPAAADTGAKQSSGRKRKPQRQAPAAAANSPQAPTAQGTPLPAPSWADVVAGKATSAQSLAAAICKVQELVLECSRLTQFGETTFEQLQQQRITNSEQLEHLRRHSKRNNIVVFGVPESSLYSTPAALAKHIQKVLFEAAPASQPTAVCNAFRLGKWRADQQKPRAILVELLSVSAKHVAFQASSRLRAAGIRLDEDLTPKQLQGRRALSYDFLRLKSRGYKPFFRGATLKYRDGAVVCKCAHGEANKVVADAVRAAQTAPFTSARPPQHRRPEHTSVAMDPAEFLRQAAVTIQAAVPGPRSAVDDEELPSAVIAPDVGPSA